METCTHALATNTTNRSTMGPPRLDRHAHRNACRHVCRRVSIHVWRHVCRHLQKRAHALATIARPPVFDHGFTYLCARGGRHARSRLPAYLFGQTCAWTGAHEAWRGVCVEMCTGTASTLHHAVPYAQDSGARDARHGHGHVQHACAHWWVACAASGACAACVACVPAGFRTWVHLGEMMSTSNKHRSRTQACARARARAQRHTCMHFRPRDHRLTSDETITSGVSRFRASYPYTAPPCRISSSSSTSSPCKHE